MWWTRRRRSNGAAFGGVVESLHRSIVGPFDQRRGRESKRIAKIWVFDYRPGHYRNTELSHYGRIIFFFVSSLNYTHGVGQEKSGEKAHRASAVPTTSSCSWKSATS